MDKIIMSELQLNFYFSFLLGRLEFGLFGVWSLGKVFWSSWDMPNPIQSSSIVYPDRAGHLLQYLIVLGRHARMLATLCCVSVQQPVETAMLGLTCMRK